MSRKSKKEPSRAESPDRWTISYADLLTLLLAFFVLLYSQSTLNISKFEKTAAAIAIAFHGHPTVLNNSKSGAAGILKHRPSAVPTLQPPPSFGMDSRALHALSSRASALRRAEAKLDKLLMPLVKQHEVSVQSGPLSLRITLNAKILFKGGQARLEPEAEKLLTKVAAVVRGIPANYPVVIQGYTNKVPIATTKFPSNWELSAARAISVVHLFMGNGIPGKQLSVQGFAQYHPLKLSGEGKGSALQENRRVEIVILAPAASKLGEARTGAATLAVPASTDIGISASAKSSAPASTKSNAPASAGNGVAAPAPGESGSRAAVTDRSN